MPKPDVPVPAVCTPVAPRPSLPLAPFFFFFSCLELEATASSKASGGFSGGGGAGAGGLGGGGIFGVDIHIINSLLGYRLRIRT